MTRLLWLIDSFNVGGAESLVVPFVRNHDRSRYRLSVACLTSIGGNPIEAEVMREGVAVTNLGARNLRDLAAFRRLTRLIRDERIELIHAHLTYASTWAALVSRLTGVPMIATLHVAPPAGGREGLRDRLMRFVLNRWARRVILVSAALRAQYVAGRGLDPRRAVVVHNGIDVARFRRDAAGARRRLERELAVPEGARIAVTVSVLRPGKGIEVLLAAIPAVVERVPGAVFLIVGDGPKREEWQALADATGEARQVRWAGHRRDVDAIVAGCDLFVLPTLADAFPTVLLEAMAAGLPVVASAVGGVPEIVQADVTGTLVPPADADALAAAIIHHLLDRDGAGRMGVAAVLAAESLFSTAAWIGRLDAVYGEVSREARRR
ncbi:MAG TPA: glycosyltransferase family 4 protein [Thermoanaerobaculia bacterium]|nr:glycosyltransferase family 4 protein [Thermoanaerobaculia bacterium]